MDLRPTLTRWMEEGILSAAQAAEIYKYELANPTASQERDEPAFVRSTGNDDELVAIKAPRAPFVIEGLGYVGGVLVIAAIALLLRGQWNDILDYGRLAILVTLTLALGVSGIGLTSSASPPLARFGSALWALAAVGLAGSLAQGIVDLGNYNDKPAAMFVAYPTLIFAAATWWFRRLQLQQLVLLAAVYFAFLATLAQVEPTPSTAWFGVGTVVIGLLWCLAAWRRLFSPQTFSLVVGVVVGLIGFQLVAATEFVLGFGFGAGLAAATVAAGALFRRTTFVVIGSLAVLANIFQGASHWFGGSSTEPAVLFSVGVCVIALAAVSARKRVQA